MRGRADGAIITAAVVWAEPAPLPPQQPRPRQRLPRRSPRGARLRRMTAFVAFSRGLGCGDGHCFRFPPSGFVRSATSPSVTVPPMRRPPPSSSLRAVGDMTVAGQTNPWPGITPTSRPVSTLWPVARSQPRTGQRLDRPRNHRSPTVCAAVAGPKWSRAPSREG